MESIKRQNRVAWLQAKVLGRWLRLRLCTPTPSVMHSAPSAAVCGSWRYISAILSNKYDKLQTKVSNKRNNIITRY